MKKLIALCAAALTVTLLVATLIGCQLWPATFTNTLELTVQKTSLEEASSIIGRTVPTPAYLPKGYKIQEVYIALCPEKLTRSTLILLLSDEEIERKLVTHTDRAGTRQCYEFQCKMEMTIRWFSEGGIPIRLPGKVKINEITGFIVGGGIHNELWWNWYPNPGQPGMFEFVLSASKRIPKGEMLKVAESVQ